MGESKAFLSVGSLPDQHAPQGLNETPHLQAKPLGGANLRHPWLLVTKVSLNSHPVVQVVGVNGLAAPLDLITI